DLEHAEFSLRRSFALVRVGSALLSLFAANSSSTTLSLSARDKQAFVTAQIMEIDRHFKDFKHDYESLLRWQNNNAILTGTAVSVSHVYVMGLASGR
ncbi:hypothetical protein HDU99_002758, partial [Rhizoclosmatium hyalinum]